MRTALKELRRGGVQLDCIPDPAMALLEDAHTPRECRSPGVQAEGDSEEVNRFNIMLPNVRQR